jgi:hypothetical protein
MTWASAPPGSTSLLGTAHLNGLNIETYLSRLFVRLPEHPIHRIEEFLL